MDDDDDTASFYLLNKFSPKEMLTGNTPKGNQALRSLTSNRSTDKNLLKTEGFHNTLFTAIIDETDPPEIYKWTVKSMENPKLPNPETDGIWNCDTNYVKDTSLTKTFLHQV